MLREVAGWTGFLNEFTHVSEGVARAEDLGVTMCAVLVAEACNIGLEPVVRAGTPALTRARLSWVDQNYIRGETITAATSRFVDAQGEVQLAQAWGGEVASADGLRTAIQRSALPGMSSWRKRLFIALAHNAANPTEYFRLPHERTIVMGTWVNV